MTTSFSGTVETGRAPRPEAPVAGTDGVLVLDTAQRCLSADTVLAHLFDLDAGAFEDRALTDTALPKPLIAVLAETSRSPPELFAKIVLSSRSCGDWMPKLATGQPARLWLYWMLHELKATVLLAMVTLDPPMHAAQAASLPDIVVFSIRTVPSPKAYRAPQ